jgi:outer membrane lipoprotein
LTDKQMPHTLLDMITNIIPCSWRSISKRYCLILTAIIVFSMAASGCAPAISKTIRAEAVDVGFARLAKNPDPYKGKTVIYSGTILNAVNTSKGTELTIIQHPSMPGHRPETRDRSDGRFLALDSRFLDPALYSPGREITVAGIVEGKQTLPVGETSYDYPVLRVRELHLWKSRWPVGFYFSIGTQF